MVDPLPESESKPGTKNPRCWNQKGGSPQIWLLSLSFTDLMLIVTQVLFRKHTQQLNQKMGVSPKKVKGVSLSPKKGVTLKKRWSTQKKPSQ